MMIIIDGDENIVFNPASLSWLHQRSSTLCQQSKKDNPQQFVQGSP